MRISKSMIVLFLGSVGLAAAGSVLTGCGTAGSGLSSIVTAVQVKTYTSNNDLYGQLSASLNTGSLLIAGISLPILDPHDPTITYGTVSLNSMFCTSTPCSGSELDIQLDITQVLRSSAEINTLPNGTTLPLGGLGNTSIVGLNVGSSQAKVYVGVGGKVAVLGVALAFKEFDKIGGYAPGIDVFQPFTLGTVNGSVGIFTGAKTGQSGIALFVNMSGLIPSSVTTQGLVEIAAPATSVAPLTFETIAPKSNNKLNKLYNAIYWMNQDETELHLQ